MSQVKLILTKEQKEKLTELWFVYGNGGKKHTDLNHKYIQGFLEHGEDDEKAYRNADLSRMKKTGRDLNKVRLTEECVKAVKEILNN